MTLKKCPSEERVLPFVKKNITGHPQSGMKEKSFEKYSFYGKKSKFKHFYNQQ